MTSSATVFLKNDMAKGSMDFLLLFLFILGIIMAVCSLIILAKNETVSAKIKFFASFLISSIVTVLILLAVLLTPFI